MRRLLKYCKKHKWGVIYIIYAIWGYVALLKGFKIEDSFGIQSIKFLEKIHPVFIALLIVVATGISLYAVIRFDEDKDVIVNEAVGVGIDSTVVDKIKKRLDLISCKPIRGAMMLSAGLACFVVSIASGGTWQKYTYKYACLLVGLLIGVTLYGYIYFFVIIMCMKEVYKWDFRQYTYIYPLATEIFDKFNGVCTCGLICFWAIGIILIFLSLVVLAEKALGLILIIGGLIFFGYVFFTFYPYYLTRRKVSLLKLQTIRTIFLARNMMIKANYDKYIEMIKNVSDSPNVLSTNFNLVVTSTFTAVAGLLTSIYTLWTLVQQ